LERGGIVILRCDPFKNRTPKQNIIKLDKFWSDYVHPDLRI
jgi:hypothetical protein